MNAVEYKTRFGTVENLVFEIHQYQNNMKLAITTDAYYGESFEPFCGITVNLPQSDSLAVDEQFVDVNDAGQGIVNWLEENGFATDTGKRAQSGYVEFPVMKFNLDKVREYALVDDFIGLEPEKWQKLESKSVPDYDGFTTEYTLYKNVNVADEPKFVCVFGDSEIYRPEDHDYDYYGDTYEKVKEWFDDYKGFEEPDIYEKIEADTEQDFYETCGGAVSIPVSDFTKAMFDKDKSLDVEPERKMPSIHEQISDAEVRADAHNAEIDMYEPDDLEVGFNPYLGSYDFDC